MFKVICAESYSTSVTTPTEALGTLSVTCKKEKYSEKVLGLFDWLHPVISVELFVIIETLFA